MPEPSKRSQLIPFSPIRVMFRLADELDRSGDARGEDTLPPERRRP